MSNNAPSKGIFFKEKVKPSKENFLLDEPAADPDPEEHEMTIDEKVESYRRELEAEAASAKLEASRPGKEA